MCRHPSWSTASWTFPKDLRQFWILIQMILNTLLSAISRKSDKCDMLLNVIRLVPLGLGKGMQDDV